MPVSKPMGLVALRMTDEERAALERLARERNVTMTWVLKEGLRLYAQDARRALSDHPDGGPVITA